MKIKSLLTVIAALAMGANFAVADEDTPLAKEMSAFNKNLRTLKRQAPDSSKKAESLALVEKMKANIAASMKLEPAKTKEQPAGDKTGYLGKYKAQLEDVDKTLDKLKAAIEKG